jgi:anti-anti-sigma regulatory factor
VIKPAPDTILVGCFGDVAWIRVDGLASMRNSGTVREFAEAVMARNPQPHFVVDLEECPGMDSTFMGMLTAIVLRMAKAGSSGSVEIINANLRNQQSLKKLGLTALLDLDTDDSTWRSERELVVANLKKPPAPGRQSKEERTQMMLDAHEALVEANAKNVSEFQDVIDFLREDLSNGA